MSEQLLTPPTKEEVDAAFSEYGKDPTNRELQIRAFGLQALLENAAEQGETPTNTDSLKMSDKKSR